MYKERNSTGQKEKGNDILKYEKKKKFPFANQILYPLKYPFKLQVELRHFQIHES